MFSHFDKALDIILDYDANDRSGDDLSKIDLESYKLA